MTISNEMRWAAFCYARTAHKAAGSNSNVQEGLGCLYDALSYTCDTSNYVVADLVRRARLSVAAFRAYHIGGRVLCDAAHIIDLLADLFEPGVSATTLRSIRTQTALVIQYVTRGGPVWGTPYAEASMMFVDTCAVVEGCDLCQPDVDKVVFWLRQGDNNVST